MDKNMEYFRIELKTYKNESNELLEMQNIIP